MGILSARMIRELKNEGYGRAKIKKNLYYVEEEIKYIIGDLVSEEVIKECITEYTESGIKGWYDKETGMFVGDNGEALELSRDHIKFI